MINVSADGGDELLNITKNAAAQAVLSQVAEKAFHHIQPGAAGGREVDLEAGMASKPALHFFVFVGGIVVDDQMDSLVLRHDVIDNAQEPQPFLMAMAVVAHRNDTARIAGRCLTVCRPQSGALAHALRCHIGEHLIQICPT